jgi:predicted O-methyltransferase YrrM
MTEFAERVKPLIADVPGWLTDEEGEALYDLARGCTGRGAIVEIGSWKGKSTICLGLGARAGEADRIFAIDPHADYRFEDFKANVERAGIADLVTPIPSLSHAAAGGFDEPIELLFVDGSHEYDLVLEDFEEWVPKVVEGGWVAFHTRRGRPARARSSARRSTAAGGSRTSASSSAPSPSAGRSAATRSPTGSGTATSSA